MRSGGRARPSPPGAWATTGEVAIPRLARIADVHLCGPVATDRRRLRDAVAKSALGRSEPRIAGWVIGQVWLWGKVIEAERGWRAALAYPNRLFLPVGGIRPGVPPEEIIRDLTTYGVPIKTISPHTTPHAQAETLTTRRGLLQ
jgi:hypothetical protein